MNLQNFWKTLGKYNCDKKPSTEDIECYNEIMYQRKLDHKVSQINRLIEQKISKISRQLERRVGCYPADSALYQLFLSNLNINEFESIKEELQVILTEINSNNKQVQSILHLIEEFNNPQIGYTPLLLDEVEIPQPEKQIIQNVSNGINKKNTNDGMFDYLRHESGVILKPLLFCMAVCFAGMLLDKKPKNRSQAQRQLEFRMPILNNDININNSNFYNVSLAKFIEAARKQGILHQVLGVEQILEDIKPRLEQISAEKNTLAFTRLIYTDYNTGQRFDNGVNLPLGWIVNQNHSTLTAHTNRPNPLLRDTPIYITTTYVNGQFLRDDNNVMVFLKQSVELTDFPKD